MALLALATLDKVMQIVLLTKQYDKYFWLILKNTNVASYGTVRFDKLYTVIEKLKFPLTWRHLGVKILVYI